jgi:hypothetical protein
MSIGTRGNHTLSIDTTFDPCYFSLDSTFNGLYNLRRPSLEKVTGFKVELLRISFKLHFLGCFITEADNLG